MLETSGEPEANGLWLSGYEPDGFCRIEVKPVTVLNFAVCFLDVLASVIADRPRNSDETTFLRIKRAVNVRRITMASMSRKVLISSRQMESGSTKFSGIMAILSSMFRVS